MTDQKWLSVITHISKSKPVDLDRLIFDEKRPEPAQKGSREIVQDDRMFLKPSTLLFQKTDPTKFYIGVRVFEFNEDRLDLAIRLASTALEKGVIPIIITTLDECGLEHFGFRVERLNAATPEELAEQEEEIVSFWDIAIVVDAADAISLH